MVVNTPDELSETTLGQMVTRECRQGLVDDGLDDDETMFVSIPLRRFKLAPSAIASGLLLGTSRQAPEGDRQNRNILRGVGLAFFTVGLFSAVSWLIPWVLSFADKNVAQLVAWALLVPSMLFFLSVLTRARRAM